MSLGQNIKRLREKQGMMQQELARALGVSESTVSFWESDKRVPRMGKIEGMSKLFNVLKSEIIEGDVAERSAFFDLYDLLSEGGKKQATQYVRFLVQGELQVGSKSNPGP